MTQWTGSIYIITNKINQKIYVGQTTGSVSVRYKGHKNEARSTRKGSVLYSAMRKYGIENFIVTPICNTKEEYLDEMEIFFIKYFNSLIPGGYNMTTGGHANKHLSELTKFKISVGNTGKKLSEEHKQQVSLAQTGVPNTPEQNKNISLGLIGRVYPKGRRASEEEKNKRSLSSMGENNGFYKHTHTTATREKIGLLKKGKPSAFSGHKHTKESKEKSRVSHLGQVAWNKGRLCSEEEKAAIKLVRQQNREEKLKRQKCQIN